MSVAYEKGGPVRPPDDQKGSAQHHKKGTLIMNKQDIIESAWRDKAAELTVHFYNHFINRIDRYGTYRIDGNGKVTPVTAHLLTEERVTTHCRLDGIPIGAIAGNPENDSTKFLCLDLDVHSETDDPECIYKDGAAIRDFLSTYGLKALTEHSNGKGGQHLWVLFSPAIEMATAYRLGEYISEHIAAGKPEHFPKRLTCETESGKNCGGGWIRLPGRHHKREFISEIMNEQGEWCSGEQALELLLSAPINSPVLPAELLHLIEPAPEPEKSKNEITFSAPYNEVVPFTNNYELCAKWITSRAPAAIEGQRGLFTTWSVGCTVYHNFAVTDRAHWQELMEQWNSTCVPPWDTKDISDTYDRLLKKTDFSGMRGDCLIHIPGFDPIGSQSHEQEETETKSMSTSALDLATVSEEWNEMTCEQLQWEWEMFAAKGKTLLLAGDKSIGKTTWLCQLLSYRGKCFLHPMRDFRAYVLAEDTGTWAAARDKWCAAAQASTIICDYNKIRAEHRWYTPQATSHFFLKVLVPHLKQHHIDVLLLDSLTSLFPSAGDFTNKTLAPIGQLIRDVAEAAQVAVILTCHARKQGGYGLEAALGGGVLPSYFDQRMLFRRPGKVNKNDLWIESRQSTDRTIVCEGRYGYYNKTIELTFDTYSESYSIADGKEQEEVDQRAKFYELVKSDGTARTRAEWQELCGLPERTVRHYLTANKNIGTIAGKPNKYVWAAAGIGEVITEQTDLEQKGEQTS